MGSYILAIDQGTTGSTTLLVDTKRFKIVAKATREFSQIFPRPGYVEHNLEDIWKSVVLTIKDVLKKSQIHKKEILGIGITNQRETVGFFDQKGTPLYNAIVWQDRRSTDFCEQLIKENNTPFIKQKSGLPIDPYFSATKIRWGIDNIKKIKTAYHKGSLKVGTIDSFLISRLTSRPIQYTDTTNASRYLLMDIKKGSWSDDLLNIFKLKKDILPEIKDSFSNFGATKGLKFLPDGIPITSILGDQQAALLGQGGVNVGDLKCTYGTGSFMVLNIGHEVKYSDVGLLTTVAYKKGEEIAYAFEGSSYIAGAAVQWLRDQLNFFKTASAIESIAKKVKNEEIEYLQFLPFFSGIGTPYWKPNAKGVISGLTREIGIPHLSKACLEGIALSINDLLNAFKKNFNSGPITSLKVDGGATSNNLLLQMQANFSNIEIIRPKSIETTGIGATFGASIGLGLLSDPKDVTKYWKKEKSFSPQKDTYYQNKRDLWAKSIPQFYL